MANENKYSAEDVVSVSYDWTDKVVCVSVESIGLMLEVNGDHKAFFPGADGVLVARYVAGLLATLTSRNVVESSPRKGLSLYKLE